VCGQMATKLGHSRSKLYPYKRHQAIREFT
jgi:hypothetical protein